MSKLTPSSLLLLCIVAHTTKLIINRDNTTTNVPYKLSEAKLHHLLITFICSNGILLIIHYDTHVWLLTLCTHVTFTIETICYISQFATFTTMLTNLESNHHDLEIWWWSINLTNLSSKIACNSGPTNMLKKINLNVVYRV
jgi:hypothetical protein